MAAIKTVLIAGGAGYIGSHTTRYLMERGYKCVVLDNLSTGHQEAIVTPFFEKVDLRDGNGLDAVFSKYSIDAVLHFAAFINVGDSVTDPAYCYDNNVAGTLSLLRAMIRNKVKNLVFSSTCAVYGEPAYMPLDEKHVQAPISPYGWSKLMCEQMMQDFQRAYDLRYIALRYFNAAGCTPDASLGESHDPETHLIPLVLQAIQGKRDAVHVFGTDYPTEDGTCKRDYIHVDDLASAHALALEKLGTFCGGINLGTGVPTSVKEIITAAEKVSGKRCPVRFGERRRGDPAVLCASNSLAKKILGWTPEYMAVEDILRTAWAWECQRKF